MRREWDEHGADNLGIGGTTADAAAASRSRPEWLDGVKIGSLESEDAIVDMVRPVNKKGGGEG